MSFCLLFGVWALGIGSRLGGKEKMEKGKEKRRRKKKEKKKEKKKDQNPKPQKTLKGLRISSLLQSPFFFCVLPHFTISRAPFSFLFSIGFTEKQHAHARTLIHTHTHRTHSLKNHLSIFYGRARAILRYV